MPLVPITLPQLGESIAEGTIVSILVAVGDSVAADQEIFEVETQKATMGVPALCAGTIASIATSLNDTHPVGHVLAYLEASDEEVARTGVRTTENKQSSSAPISTTAGGSDRVEPVVHGLPVPAQATGASYISPRMRARMDELGLNAADLASIAGTGAGGRVTVRDFETFLEEIDRKTTSPASPMRVAVADSMRRSWTRPLATVGVPVCLDTLLAHRAGHAAPKPGPALYVLRALAMALAENPAVGGRLIGKRLVHPDAIDIGFAVEVEDGVLVPVIRNADASTLDELLAPYQDLVAKSRARKLSKDESKPGIATVTNYGTFGILWASPIPLPEQNLVLGLGAAAKRPRWSESKGTFVPVTEAVLTLSFDHRVLDGGAAGRLLGRIAALLQTPEALINPIPRSMKPTVFLRPPPAPLPARCLPRPRPGRAHLRPVSRLGPRRRPAGPAPGRPQQQEPGRPEGFPRGQNGLQNRPRSIRTDLGLHQEKLPGHARLVPPVQVRGLRPLGPASLRQKRRLVCAQPLPPGPHRL